MMMQTADETASTAPDPTKTTGMRAHSLRIRGLGHRYSNGVQALQDIDLDIPSGIYGLLGPNGAGKSTLMRVIASLQRPSQGSVHFDDIDVLAEPQRLRRVLGYLPQEFGTYPGVSALDLLDHIAVLKGLGPTKARRNQIDALLKLTNLHDARNRAVSGFSGGMKRRFGIAQAMLGDPQLLIVDEPTAGLDPAERAHFHDLLTEIGEDKVVILSTHVLDDVQKLCPRLAIVLKGRVVAAGEVSMLLANLAGHIWRKPVARVELEDLRRTHHVLTKRYADGKSIVHVLADTNPGPGFEVVTGDMQDVYFALTADDEETTVTSGRSA
jgi:ABC-2 type transport system ATP-binding protein